MNRRALLPTALLLALAVAADVIAGAKGVPGYYAGIGLLGGVAIILVAGAAGTVLSRPERTDPDTAAGTTGEERHDG